MQLAINTRPCSAFLTRRPNRVARSAHHVYAVQFTQKVIVTRNPTEDVLKAKGVRSWPTWGCEANKFPWTYTETEECYLIEGSVVVTPNGGEAVEINAGDMAVFPAGMSCTWDVKKAILKHYNFR